MMIRLRRVPFVRNAGYPYLIANQMGFAIDFKQPYVTSPGIGVFPYEEPLKLENGQIIAKYWPDGTTLKDMQTQIISRLENLMLFQPYNNLGVNGAILSDLRNTTSSLNPNTGNYFFDIVLRNTTPLLYPNFGGKTAVQEAALLKPDIILLWIGNNDILGAVLNGSDQPHTDSAAFEAEYRKLLSDLKESTTAHIVMANIPKYLPFGFGLDDIYVNNALTVFDPETFIPIDFGSSTYVPLLLAETGARHLLLTGAIEYLEHGTGIPIMDATKDGIIQSHGLTASGVKLDGKYTITLAEEQAIFAVIDQYNEILENLSAEYDVPLVDIVASWWGKDANFGGYSGKYAIQDQENTTFSLDGVHPNNLGHALSANAFIKVLNENYQLSIPQLDPENYKGQYTGKSINKRSLQSIKRVMEILAPRRN